MKNITSNENDIKIYIARHNMNSITQYEEHYK